MKTWQYIILIAVGIAALLAILYFVPATSHLVRGILAILMYVWIAIAGTLVMVVILGFGVLFGFLLKAFGVGVLDSKLEKGKEITEGMHWGIAIVFGFVCGVLQTLFMPVFMAWETWMRWLAIGLGWSGVYETLPLFWLFYCLVVFVIAYQASQYLIEQPEPERRRGW